MRSKTTGKTLSDPYDPWANHPKPEPEPPELHPICPLCSQRHGNPTPMCQRQNNEEKHR